MTDRQTLRIRVLNSEQYDDDWPKGSLPAVISWFQEKLTLIPESYRDSSECEIDSASSYEGSCRASIEISYSRPETDEQMADRQRREEAKVEFSRLNELRMLHILRARYPDA